MNFKAFVENCDLNHSGIMYLHDGGFHADDVLSACFVRYLVFNCTWKRTRDIPADAFAVDVGGGQYDHHSVPRPQWARYGVPHCGSSRLWEDPDFQFQWRKATGLGEAGCEWIERNLLLPICREDNGMKSNDNNLLAFVRHINPPWDVQGDLDRAFEVAVHLTEAVLSFCIEQGLAADRAQRVLADLPDEEIVQIPAGLTGWKDHLPGKTTKFVVYPALSGGWSVQAVPPAPDRVTEQKIPHPESWRGLRNEDLSAASGLPGGVFCHASGFLSIWATEADAWRAARHLLRQAQDNVLRVTEDELRRQEVLRITEDDLSKAVLRITEDDLK
ncbi:MAG: MYG1 family protein [Clostridia bacterium]|nr:MYG1 family protein [Clostridia bacterium]